MTLNTTVGPTVPPHGGAHAPTQRGGSGTRLPVRLALMAMAGVCVLAGLDAALLRLDVWAPVAGTLSARLAALHGPLMLVGFLGSLIALERAVASHRRWAYLAPAASAGGCLLLVVGTSALVGQLLVLAGSLVLVAVYATVYRRAPSTALDVEACGGLALVLGNLVWLAPTLAAALGGCASALCPPAATTPWLATGVPAAVPLWLAFPVLTIVGERLELARVAFLDPLVETTVRALAVATVLACCGLLLTDAAHLMLGPVLVATGVVMAWYDVARRTVRSTGAVRFAAASMLAGYVWLVVAGLVWTMVPELTSGPAYEIVIHCLALGFGLSMILAHAPTIVPAIVHRRLSYHWLMWVPFALLHAGLAVRVLGLVGGQARAWQAGGVLGVLALLSFLAISLPRAITGGSIRTHPVPRPRPEQPASGPSSPPPARAALKEDA